MHECRDHPRRRPHVVLLGERPVVEAVDEVALDRTRHALVEARDQLALHTLVPGDLVDDLAAEESVAGFDATCAASSCAPE
jgi:hypothetical protein